MKLEVIHGEAARQGFPEPRNTRMTQVLGLADTGAQMCVSGMDVAIKMGLKRTDLLAPQLRISVADNSGLTIVGAAFIMITGPAGHSTRQLVFFADNVSLKFRYVWTKGLPI